jgi:hypothetical protein
VTPAERRWALAIGGLALVGLVLLGVLWAVGPGLIADAYHQKPGALLGGIISGQGRFPLEGYLLFFRRTVLSLAVATACVGVLVPWVLRWNAGRGAVSGRAGVIAVALCAVAIVGLRARTYDEAQDRDLAAYMTVADGMLHGKTLYQQVWDHKPPAIHLTYAASSALFGPSQLALWMMGVTAALVTLVACYRAGAARGGTIGGVAAAGVWALASGDLLLQANQPNAEVFMNAALAWAFVLLAAPAPRSLVRWVAIGALYLWASLYKPVIVAIAGLVIAADVLNVILAAPATDPLPRRLWRALQGPLVCGATAGLGWALVFAYFAGVGRFAEFQEAVFAYNRDYAGSMVQNLMASLVPNGSVIWTAAPYFPLLVVTGAGAAWIAIRKAGDDGRLLLAYLAGAWIAVALPGRLFPHYYQLLLPPLAIGAGWLVVRALAARATPGLVAIAAALTLALTARVYQSLVTVDEAPRLKFGGYGYDLLETQRMGPWITAHLPAGGVLYHWGPEPGVYFFAGQRTPVPWVYNMPLTDKTPRAERYSAALLAQLQAQPPDLVVASRRELRVVDHPVETWLEQRYRAVDGPAGVDRFVFLVPKGEAGAATAAKD